MQWSCKNWASKSESNIIRVYLWILWIMMSQNMMTMMTCTICIYILYTCMYCPMGGWKKTSQTSPHWEFLSLMLMMLMKLASSDSIWTAWTAHDINRLTSLETCLSSFPSSSFWISAICSLQMHVECRFKQAQKSWLFVSTNDFLSHHFSPFDSWRTSTPVRAPFSFKSSNVLSDSRVWTFCMPGLPFWQSTLQRLQAGYRQNWEKMLRNNRKSKSILFNRKSSRKSHESSRKTSNKPILMLLCCPRNVLGENTDDRKETRRWDRTDRTKALRRQCHFVLITCKSVGQEGQDEVWRRRVL